MLERHFLVNMNRVAASFFLSLQSGFREADGQVPYQAFDPVNQR